MLRAANGSNAAMIFPVIISSVQSYLIQAGFKQRPHPVLETGVRFPMLYR
jgi:hypothetical protein